jgi:two-component system, NarL family, nitrate/nitrite response regulator NarL
MPRSRPGSRVLELGVGAEVGLVVADGHQAFAEGLAVLLAAEHHFAVLGVAHDHRRAVELAGHHRPAVLLLDAYLPGGEPAETLTAVKAASPATRVLLLAVALRSSKVAAAIGVGAAGVVAKDGSSRQLADAVRRVVDGKRVRVGAARPPRPAHPPSVEQLRGWALSQREREVLSLLAVGWSTRRIAQERHVTPATVRTHIQNLLVKLGVHPQLEAVAFAFQHGMVTSNGGAPWDRYSA